MAEVLVPVEETISVVFEIVDAAVPRVVSNVILAAVPLVLAATVITPLISILLLVIKLMSEPLPPVMAPD